MDLVKNIVIRFLVFIVTFIPTAFLIIIPLAIVGAIFNLSDETLSSLTKIVLFGLNFVISSILSRYILNWLAKRKKKKDESREETPIHKESNEKSSIEFKPIKKEKPIKENGVAQPTTTAYKRPTKEESVDTKDTSVPENDITVKNSNIGTKMEVHETEEIKDEVIYHEEEDTYSEQKTFIFNVAGTTYDNDKGINIQNLLRQYVDDWLNFNDSYEEYTNQELYDNLVDERIYEANVFDFPDITFEHNPDNPYDSNAIKVIHSELGHIGHVPKQNNQEFLEYMEYPYNVDGRIVGGRYKYYDAFEDKISIGTYNYGVKLFVTFKM